jgi:hypothetical protein
MGVFARQIPKLNVQASCSIVVVVVIAQRYLYFDDQCCESVFKRPLVRQNLTEAASSNSVDQT